MGEVDDKFEQRLATLGQAWRELRYSGPELEAVTPGKPSPLMLWWLAPVAAASLAAFVLWPGAGPAITWPDNLRPVMRGSPFAASAPPAPQVSFRLPGAPSRQSCISPAVDCDQPAG